MALVVPVAHDFCCGWCWIGLHQIKRLKAEFGMEIEWRPFEQAPAELPEPPNAARERSNPDRPDVPSRYRLALAAEGVERPPADLPFGLVTAIAHQAVEFAKKHGTQDELVERIYGGFWRHCLRIDDPKVIGFLATGLVPDVADLLEAIREGRFADRITPFDEPAFARGVYNVPTFWIGEKRYAEQPYEVLRQAVAELHDPIDRPASEIYEALSLPRPPKNRPYVLINMVSTIDGKTVSGEEHGHVMDLGSPVDHLVMRRIEGAVDAVMIGARTLRSTQGLWYAERLKRFVVTRSGNLDFSSRFFSDAPDKAFVIAPRGLELSLEGGIRAIQEGDAEVDMAQALRKMRQEFGVSSLLCEGGSELNASFLEHDLVDELFLTISPKVKLGKGLPTYAGGRPLPGRQMQDYELLEHHRFGDELFLRYRRKDAARGKK